MSDDRIAKENLRRRFEQNQEDCSFTVLAILPTATEEIMERLNVEQVLEELQRQKAERVKRSIASIGPSEIGTSAPPSVADTMTETEGGEEGDAASSVVTTEGFVHASQVVGEGQGEGEGNGTAVAGKDEEKEGSVAKEAVPVSVQGKKDEAKENKKNKAQLWNEMKISCKYPSPHLSPRQQYVNRDTNSNNPRPHPPLYPHPPHPPHPHPTQPPRSQKLPRLRRISRRPTTSQHRRRVPTD